VAAESALTESGHVVVDVDGNDVAVFKIDVNAMRSRMFALTTALKSPAVNSTVTKSSVRARRALLRQNGEVKCAPAYENLATFPVGWSMAELNQR